LPLAAALTAPIRKKVQLAMIGGLLFAALD
jgi:hypothetical protein